MATGNSPGGTAVMHKQASWNTGRPRGPGLRHGTGAIAPADAAS
jgi:hypothetical protein